MNNPFWAKSNPPETIAQHTNHALYCFNQLKKLRPEILAEIDWNILQDTVIHHDLGKIDIKFQNTICRALHQMIMEDLGPDFPVIPHNILSCAFLDKKVLKKKYGKEGLSILAKAIYYHHDRDFKDNEELLYNYIKTILPAYAQGFQWNLSLLPVKLDADMLTKARFEDEDKVNFSQEQMKRYVLIKGLLNRIDYGASAAIEKIEESEQDEDGQTIQERVQALFVPQGNYQMRPVQKFMKDHRKENLVVTAATGIGKTEAALLWIGHDKGFYTLPLKVSINAIYERIIHDIHYKKATLLHSDALSYQIQARRCKTNAKEEINQTLFDEAGHAYTCARLLANPLTITTIDQLFKFVFRYNGGEMQLATLSYSHLVIDEIQMYSPELVAIILIALQMIAEVGGKFAIITATFPPILHQLMAEQWENAASWMPICSPVFHSNITKRHRIRLLKEKNLDYSFILQQAKQKKILILANTVARAQEIYRKLQNNLDIPVYLLHASFMKKDRAILENSIKNFAPNHQETGIVCTGIWVSTQIVEASLDIDFDILFTEMCTIDSLLQRMGRVYRSRMYDLGEEPNVYILDGKNGFGGVINSELYNFSLASVAKHDGELLEESDQVDAKQAMIAEVYDPEFNQQILKSEYCREIREYMRKISYLPLYEISGSEVKKIFRSIDTITVMPEAIYHELELDGIVDGWKEKLKSKDTNMASKQLVKDEIFDYTIQLSYYHGEFSVLKQNGWLYDKYKIYLYDGTYDFDEKNHKGEGLKRERRKKGNPALKEKGELW